MCAWLTYLSLGLEVTGFLLAVVETVWPQQADVIEAKIDYYSAKIPLRDVSGEEGIESIKEESRSFLISLIILCISASVYISLWHRDAIIDRLEPIFEETCIVIVVICIGLFLIRYAYEFFGIIFLSLASTFMFAVSIIAWIISYFLIGMNRIAHGRALGAFGLTLAFVGLVMEFTQIILCN